MIKKTKNDAKKTAKEDAKTTSAKDTKKVAKKSAKTPVKKDVKKIVKKTVKKVTDKKVTKEKKKKDESFLIALLKQKDLIFVSWKIAAPSMVKEIKTAEKDTSAKSYLFINILSVENGKHVKIESIPVHGLENNWHVFVKNEYSGKTIVCSLIYSDKKGKSQNIFTSDEINIPYSIESLLSGKNLTDEEKIILELSGIKNVGTSTSDNTSW